MPTSSLSSKINYRNARQFVDTVNDGSKSFYVFIGRPQEWPGLNDEPLVVDNTLASEYEAWYDITAMKRVSQQDVRLGFKRINWTADTIFTEYSHEVDLTDLNFYVITNENKVYKCISNNNGAVSTIKPTHITADVQKLSDNYRWKYMFTLSDSLMRKFSVSQYLPIDSNETVVANATQGSIEHLKLVSGGTGYFANASASNGTALPVFVNGDGDRVATATCTIVTSGGAVQSIAQIESGGGGYPTPPEESIPVMIRQISTTGAVESAFGIATTNTEGSIVSVQRVVGGSGYVSGTAFIVHSSCKGYAETNSQGVITNVEISNGYAGRNFRFATATVVALSSTPAVVKPIISPFNGHGFSPERELFANYVLINMRIAYAEGQGDFTVANDFRRIGLIEDPYTFGTTTVATADTLDAKRTLVLNNLQGNFTEDDTIFGQNTGAKGLFVDLVNGNKLRYIRDTAIANTIDFALEPITSASGGTAAVTQIIEPEVDPYSGDILFINNRVAIDRSIDQIETISLVLEY
jgi:hypothetical protein